MYIFFLLKRSVFSLDLNSAKRGGDTGTPRSKQFARRGQILPPRLLLHATFFFCGVRLSCAEMRGVEKCNCLNRGGGGVRRSSFFFVSLEEVKRDFERRLEGAGPPDFNLSKPPPLFVFLPLLQKFCLRLG